MKTPPKFPIAALTLSLGYATVIIAADSPRPSLSDLSCSGSPPARVLSEAAASKLIKSIPVTGGSKPFASLDVMHDEYVRQFQTAPGFGDSRMLRLPRYNELVLPEFTYTIKLPDLISVENEPVVYRSSETRVIGMNVLTNRAMRPHLPKRELTAAEAKAVERLRAGETMTLIPDLVTAPWSQLTNVAQPKTIPGLIAVGALRAGKTCADCHGCEEGTLLGAFSYQLIPKPTTNAPIPFIARQQHPVPATRTIPAVPTAPAAPVAPANGN